MIRLSKRLHKIATLVPAESKVADIGSDHALLPVYLAEQRKLVKGVAGEVNVGPRDAAARQVSAAGYTNLIDVRLGDGLEVIEAGEVNVITIAGMGGALIVSILEKGKAKLSGVTRLILQPNVGEDRVRSWLDDNGWFLSEEHILEDDGKIYEILIAIPAQNAVPTKPLYGKRRLPGGLLIDHELLLKMGPYLLDAAEPIWIRKWELELGKLQKIADQMTGAETEVVLVKRRQLLFEMKQIQEVLECQRTDKPLSN